MSTTRSILQGLAAAAALGLAALALRPSPVEVEAGLVSRGRLEVAIEEDGETRVRERFVLAAPVAGRLLRVSAKAGDPVEAGRPLARLAPVPLDRRSRDEARSRLLAVEAERSAAHARLGQARAALDEALSDRARAEGLAAQALLSPDDLDHARVEERKAVLEVEAAEHRLTAATHEVDTARAALVGAETSGEAAVEPVALASPVRGRVLRVLEEGERLIAAGAPVVEVGDPSDLEVVLDLLTDDASRVRPGMPVRVVAGAVTATGRVRLIEPSAFTRVSALGVDEQRVNVVCDLDAAPASLGDRYRVEGAVVTWEGAAVLQVPASALFRSGAGWAVLAIEEGRARLRPVEPGRRGALAVEVREGLAEGATVVLYPSDRVSDGTRVSAAAFAAP